MEIEFLGEPCRNFNILGSATIVDPVDGLEKVVLSNFAAGAVGNLIFVDPRTGKGESISLPGDEGAWAILNLDDKRLLVGTCPGYGYLHSLDLKSREWAQPLRDEGECYIWNLCRGSDGMVYGGTYPGCVLLRYDPARHVLENMGRMSEEEDNLYSRMVYGEVPGHVLVTCGFAAPHLTLWNVETQVATRFGKPGAQVREVTADWICTVTDGELDFYNSTTFEALPQDLSDRLTPAPQHVYEGTKLPVTLRDGSTFAVRGQAYCIAHRDEAKPVLKPIPTPRPATHILTITADAHGKIWGSSGFGQTIFSYDPSSGEHWNSEVVCDRGGEVYGMAFAGERLFLSAYSGGEHVVYAPGETWNQVDNRNPQTLRSVSPALIRPSAKSVIGPDGNFWTGWMARYGVYGGGLSRVDVGTLQVTSWYDPIPEQAVVGLGADDRYLYFSTGGGANGLPSRTQPFAFVVWDPDGREIWRKRFAEGVTLGQATSVGQRVLLQVDAKLAVFNPDIMAFERSIDVGEPCACVVSLGTGGARDCCDAVVFGQSALWRVNVLTGAVTYLCDVPGAVTSATVTPDGDLYFASGTALYRCPGLSV